MKRVYIAVALAMSMLLGSTAFAGGTSFSTQQDAKFISVGSSGHYQRGKQHYRKPQHWQKRRVAPRRQVRPAPRRIYRAPKRIYRPAPRKIYRAPKRVYRPAPRKIYRAPKHVYRPAPRRPAKRYVPRHNKWHNQKRRHWK